MNSSYNDNLKQYKKALKNPVLGLTKREQLKYKKSPTKLNRFMGPKIESLEKDMLLFKEKQTYSPLKFLNEISKNIKVNQDVSLTDFELKGKSYELIFKSKNKKMLEKISEQISSIYRVNSSSLKRSTLRLLIEERYE